MSNRFLRGTKKSCENENLFARNASSRDAIFENAQLRWDRAKLLYVALYRQSRECSQSVPSKNESEDDRRNCERGCRDRLWLGERITLAIRV